MNRICRVATCRNRCDIKDIYCEEHKGMNNKQYNKHVRYNNDNSKYSRFYHTSGWRNLRRHKLLVNPLCEVCYSNGIMKHADMVHHIIELRDPLGGWEHRLDIDNIQSICYDCHNKVEHNHSQTHN